MAFLLKIKSIFLSAHYRGVQAEGDISGSGLGLAIAKELVEQMQGKIELISPNNSTQIISYLPESSHLPGTTFIIWLPLLNNEDRNG